MKKLALIGAGSHSDAVFQIINFSSYKFVGYFDDKNIKEYNGFPILGKISDVIDALNSQIIDCVFIAIGDNDKRKEIFDLIAAEHLDSLINIVANTAVILNDNAINGKGIFIGHKTLIGAQAIINSNTIINSGCIIEHHSNIGSDCNVAPGSVINGIVTVSNQCYVGSGSVIIQGLDICSKTLIGAGAIVVKDITEKGVYVGIPAKKIKDV